MPEHDASRSYLEQAQERLLGKLGIDPQRFVALGRTVDHGVPDEVVRDLGQGPEDVNFEQHLDELAPELGGRRPTRWEIPALYSSLADRVVSIEQALAELKPGTKLAPTFGNLPTGLVNARIISVPRSDEHVLVFDAGMFTLSLLLCKAVVQAFPIEEFAGGFSASTDRQAIQRRIDTEPEVLDRFLEVVVAYVTEGSPAGASRYSLDARRYRFALEAWRSLELFVVGHEFGHLLGGHLSPAAGSSAPLLGERSVQAFRTTPAQEIEADVLALPLLLTARQAAGVDSSLAALGAGLFFSFLDVIEAGVSLLLAGDDDHRPSSTTHPPAAERNATLRYALGEFLPREAALSAIELMDIGQWIVETLWQRTRPAVLTLHEQGAKPLRVWPS